MCEAATPLWLTACQNRTNLQSRLRLNKKTLGSRSDTFREVRASPADLGGLQATGIMACVSSAVMHSMISSPGVRQLPLGLPVGCRGQGSIAMKAVQMQLTVPDRSLDVS
jgi:hypothetical protein